MSLAKNVEALETELAEARKAAKVLEAVRAALGPDPLTAVDDHDRETALSAANARASLLEQEVRDLKLELSFRPKGDDGARAMGWLDPPTAATLKEDLRVLKGDLHRARRDLEAYEALKPHDPRVEVDLERALEERKALVLELGAALDAARADLATWRETADRNHEVVLGMTRAAAGINIEPHDAREDEVRKLFASREDWKEIASRRTREADGPEALTDAINAAVACIPTDRLEAPGAELTPTAGIEALRDAVTGLAEDLECARDERTHVAPADLQRIEAMIADEKNMTWDLSKADRAMLARVRDALAPAPTVTVTPATYDATEAWSLVRRLAEMGTPVLPPALQTGPVREHLEAIARGQAKAATASKPRATPSESVASPADDGEAGPWVILRTIPKGGRQLYHEGGARWVFVADVEIGREEPLALQFADRADAEGVKRGAKLKRTRVCTYAEAMGAPAAEEPKNEGAAIDPELAHARKHLRGDHVDQLARQETCPTCSAEPGYCCSFRESGVSSLSSNRCHNARRALVEAGTAPSMRESSDVEGGAP